MRLVSADSHGKETLPGVGWYGEGEERQLNIQIYTQLEEAEKKEKKKTERKKSTLECLAVLGRIFQALDKAKTDNWFSSCHLSSFF